MDITFELDEYKKTCIKYVELDDDGSRAEFPNIRIGSIYPQKSILGKKPPSTITIQFPDLDGTSVDSL